MTGTPEPVPSTEEPELEQGGDLECDESHGGGDYRPDIPPALAEEAGVRPRGRTDTPSSIPVMAQRLAARCGGLAD